MLELVKRTIIAVAIVVVTGILFRLFGIDLFGAIALSMSNLFGS